MADHTLTPDQIASIDATVVRVHQERAAAGTMGARYDDVCERLAELHDESMGHLRCVQALEDQLHDRDAENADLRAQLAAALEQAAEAREPITVITCNGTVTTYRAVPLDTRSHRAEETQWSPS